MQFKRAEKKQAKLRLAMYGPSGSGKTYSALRIGTGIAEAIGGKIALVDTERGSASKYADRFSFDALDLDVKSILAGYLPAIETAAKEGYSVLIIDSLSHAWQELIEEVDRLAKAKYRDNKWSAWSEGTPMQRKLVDAILSYPGHIIVTMRSDTEWSQEKDERTGKIKPVKVGLKPQQGKGIEFEFDLLMEVTVDHFATVSKDRTGRFQDKVIEKPGEDFGKELVAWLNSGTPTITKAEAEELVAMARTAGMTSGAVTRMAGVHRLGDITIAQFETIKKQIQSQQSGTAELDKRNAAVNEALIRAGITSDQIDAYCQSLPFAGDMPSVVTHLERLVKDTKAAKLPEVFEAAAATAAQKKKDESDVPF